MREMLRTGVLAMIASGVFLGVWVWVWHTADWRGRSGVKPQVADPGTGSAAGATGPGWRANEPTILEPLLTDVPRPPRGAEWEAAESAEASQSGAARQWDEPADGDVPTGVSAQRPVDGHEWR